MQRPAHQQTLQGHLESGEVFLGQQELGGVAADLDVVAPEQAAMRRNAAMKWSTLLARMTPRLAERQRLETQGKLTPRAARKGSSLSARRRKRGIGTPAAARHWRIWNLSRAAVTAATAFVRRPSRSAMAAAATVVRSSTPTTARSGRRALSSATLVAAPSGSVKSSVRR